MFGFEDIFCDFFFLFVWIMKVRRNGRRKKKDGKF